MNHPKTYSSPFALILLALLITVSGAMGSTRPGPESRSKPTKVDLSALGAFFGGGESDPSEAEKGASHASHGQDGEKAERATEPTLLIAVIIPTEGNDVSGIVYFEKVASGFEVRGTIRGLSPGDHGFHVHEFGDLSASDGTSAGGHFNPQSQPHSGPDAERRHFGDLGNITADENGVAEFSFTDDMIEAKGPNSIVGRGLIVHRDADDFTSQPTGAAGPRVGMAVIGIANPDLEAE